MTADDFFNGYPDEPVDDIGSPPDNQYPPADGYFDQVLGYPAPDVPPTDSSAPHYGFDDHIVGDPATAATYWHEQQTDSTCAVAAQEFILDQFTGVDHSEAELTQVAEANGWYTPGGGTPLSDVGNVLEYYGVDVTRETGANVDDLRAALDAGDGVIVGLDSDEIWTPGIDPGEPLDSFPGIPGQGADHAVQVTGIDDSDPANPVVILNDSGSPTGAGERLAMADFLDAWEDSDKFLMVASGGQHG